VPRTRVLLLADDPLTRGGLTALLGGEPMLELVGQGTLAEAPALLGEREADVLCWDPGLEDEAAEGLVRAARERPILALLGGGASAAALLRAGVRGLVDRSATGEVLAAALQACAQGLTTLPPALASGWLRLPEPAPEGVDALTPREREVLALLAEGLGNKAIAARLLISDHTAKFLVNAILGKLGAESRAEAIVLAARRGLIVL
jgi:DNA-binding NarL/FixJ family response regulator